MDESQNYGGNYEDRQNQRYALHCRTPFQTVVGFIPAAPFSSSSTTNPIHGARDVPILLNYGDSRQVAELVGELTAGEFSRHWSKRSKCSLFSTPV